MAFLKASTPYVLATALLAAGLAPAHPAAAAPPAETSTAALEEPVTVFNLTDASGTRTAVATDGLEALEEQALTDAAAEGDLSAAGLGATGVVGGAGAAGAAGTGPVIAAVAEQLEDVAILTPPMETEEFFVAGVTWDGGQSLPEGVTVFIRALEDGQWLNWVQLEAEEALDAADNNGIGGTDPFVTGGATAVQVQVTGDAAALPANIRLSLTPPYPAPVEEIHTEPTKEPDEVPTEDPTAEPEAENVGFFQSEHEAQRAVAAVAQATAAVEPAAGLAGGAVQATAVAGTPTTVGATPTSGIHATAPAQPSIVSRAGWGANGSLMTWPVKRANLKAAVVHHTAGSNTYTQAEAPGVVRGIYHYHAVTRDWGDIGYNFLVDKWGRVYEGRTGSLSAPAGTMPIAAHAGGYNTGTLGISAMGDYTKVDVPQATMNAMADVIAWQFSRAGIDASSRSGITSPGTSYTRSGINLSRIFAHRDVGQTTCPGNDIYGQLSRLASTVSAKVGAVSSAPAPASAMRPNIFLNNAWDTIADVEFSYGGKEELFVGDWNGDGKDTIAYRVGQMFHVRNSNTTGPAEVVFAYGRPGDTILVGDWDGDGKDTFAVRRGNQYLVRNSVTTGPADVIVEYGRAGDQVLVGDWNGNGRDSLAVRRGAYYYVKNSVADGPADYVVAYGRENDTVLVGDWDGNGTDTFAVRRGAVYFIKNRIATGVADRELVYGRAGDDVLVGDWDGNRTDTLGVRRA